MLDLNCLKPIGLADKNELEPVLMAQNSPSCEISFANLAMWNQAYHTEYMKYQERILLYSPVERMIYFPVGAWFTPEELREIIKVFVRANLCEAVIYDTPPEYIDKYPELSGLFKIDSNPDNFDYIYDNRKLYESSGPKLRKKRNLIHQFENAFPDYSIKPVSKDNIDEVAALALHLNEIHEAAAFLNDENTVLEFAWRNFDALGLHGMALSCDSQIIGFSVFSFLNSEYADVHFEKCRHDFKGAPQMLCSKLAGVLAGNVKFMNREQDLGNPGIRQAKHSLDPEFQYRRATIRL